MPSMNDKHTDRAGTGSLSPASGRSDSSAPPKPPGDQEMDLSKESFGPGPSRVREDYLDQQRPGGATPSGPGEPSQPWREPARETVKSPEPPTHSQEIDRDSR